MKGRKMKWPVFGDRSSQQPQQRFVSTWPQIWSKSVEIFVICSNASAPIIVAPPQASQTTFILFILAIELAIATIFGQAESGESSGFNEYFNVLNNDFELEPECDFCDVLSSPAIDTINATADTRATGFNLHTTGVGLAKFDNLGCDLCAVLSAPATVAVATTAENENKSGANRPHTQTQQYTTAPAIHTAFFDKFFNGRLCPPHPTPAPDPAIVDFNIARAGLREQIVLKNVFDIVYDEYDLNNICEGDFNENFCNTG